MTTDITTPQTNGRADEDGLLEQILEKVESIEETVELILDRLTEYVDHVSYKGSWDELDRPEDVLY